MLYHEYTPYSRDGCIRPIESQGVGGRPRSLTASQCLGLVLTCYRTRGAEYVLSLMFGITGSVCSLFLRFGRRLLVKTLKRDALPRVGMPTQEELSQYSDSFADKYSIVNMCTV